MAIQFQCPGCRRLLSVPDPFAGRQSQCPTCAQTFLVPIPAIPASPLDFTAHAGSAGTDGAEAKPVPRWKSVQRGLGNIWMGTICLVTAVLCFALSYVLSSVADGLFVVREETAEQTARASTQLMRLLIQGGGGVFLLLSAVGVLLRLGGLLRCLRVPSGMNARMTALAALLCETIAGVSLGMLLVQLFADRQWEAGLARMLKFSQALLAADFLAVPWVPLVALLVAELIGLVFLLLFCRALGRALRSRELPKRLRRFLIGLVLIGLAVGVVVGGRHYLAVARAQQLANDPQYGIYSWQAEAYRYSYYGALLLYLLLLLLALLSYLGLLGSSSDEVQKRAGRWQPG